MSAPRIRGGPKELWRGQRVYLWHVLALITPGVETPQHEAHKVEPTPLAKWSDEDRSAMIEEGRRQADRQLSDLKEVRGRAQWLFTVGTAATVAVGTAFSAENPIGGRLALFVTSLLILGYGLAGALAIMAGRADFNLIDTAALSHKPPPIERYLAEAYSRMLREGEDTIATRITIFRQAVLWIIVGGYMGLIAALT